MAITLELYGSPRYKYSIGIPTVIEDGTRGIPSKCSSSDNLAANSLLSSMHFTVYHTKEKLIVSYQSTIIIV